ncbi:MAG: hypothetical protein ACLUNO_02780 [Oscillospiraceae bacterium]
MHAAEARVVAELRDIGKPFLVLLNTADPAGELRNRWLPT